VSSARGERRVSAADFFGPGYRQTALEWDEVIATIELPHPVENEFVFCYKQARRREDDISIVTATLRASFEKKGDKFVVTDASFAFGGVAAITVGAPETVKAMVDQVGSTAFMSLECDVGTHN
jgi:xanthine dehydrogenase/oxidase